MYCAAVSSRLKTTLPDVSRLRREATAASRGPSSREGFGARISTRSFPVAAASSAKSCSHW